MLSQVESYTVELCIVLVKEKKKKVVTAPALLILCTVSGGSSKRKQVPSAFRFTATKLCVSLFFPIETQHKQIYGDRGTCWLDE